MFETSQDLLYVVLSLSILWFTVFLCWLLYQAARAVRNVNYIVENLTQKLELITEAVEFIRAKVEKMTSHMGVVSGFASGLVEKYIVGKMADKLEKKVDGAKSSLRKKPKKKRLLI